MTFEILEGEEHVGMMLFCNKCGYPIHHYATAGESLCCCCERCNQYGITLKMDKATKLLYSKNYEKFVKIFDNVQDIAKKFKNLNGSVSGLLSNIIKEFFEEE